MSSIAPAASLQVAEFTGRSTFQLNPGQPLGWLPNLKKSPSALTQDDAERMAEKLAKDSKSCMGQPIYILHDRTSAAFLSVHLTHIRPQARRGSRQTLAAGVRLLTNRVKGEAKTPSTP